MSHKLRTVCCLAVAAVHCVAGAVVVYAADQTLSGHKGSTTGLDWHPDGQRLAYNLNVLALLCMLAPLVGALAVQAGGDLPCPLCLLERLGICLLYTSPSPRDATLSGRPAWA